MSDLRPAWLTDDDGWEQQLSALPDDDRTWIERQWRAAGGPAPQVDTSWVTYERDPRWGAVFFLWRAAVGLWLLAVVVTVAALVVAPALTVFAVIAFGAPALIFTALPGAMATALRRGWV